jgi:hypothetical protein
MQTEKLTTRQGVAFDSCSTELAMSDWQSLGSRALHIKPTRQGSLAFMLVVSLVWLCTGSEVCGQAGPSQRDPVEAPRQNWPADTPIPGQPPSVSRDTDSLSEQLSRSGGVLHPPSGIDPEIHKPAPDPAPPMPVIPPPGSPGGRQDIHPK